MQNNEVNITVIIPAYNAEKYLETAVDSILNQPYKNIRIILVDDGSKDSTPKLCDQMQHNHANICVIHQKNKGLPGARNSGIDKGLELIQTIPGLHYFAFLDSDDAWTDNFLSETVVQQLSQGFHLIGFQSCICNQGLTFRKDPLELEEKMLRGGRDSVWCHSTQSFAAMFYSVGLLQEYNIRFENVRHVEDKMFSMETCYLAETISLVPKLMYLYRMNASSLVHTRPFGTDYYPIIVDAYLHLDQKMKKWENLKRESLQQGEKIAKFYLMDMIDEHFQHFRSKKALEKYFADHKDYVDILLKNTGNDVAEKRYQEMCQNPAKHRVKNWITGAKEYLGRLALEIPFARALREKKRFTIKVSGYEENSVSNP